MCPRKPHRHSIFCILPPYILHSIAQRGTPAQRAWAMQTLSFDSTFRTLRAVRLAAPAAALRALARLATGQPQRTIFDANQTEDLPGTVIRNEGQAATGDPAVDEAYDGLGNTYDFYWRTFQRDSIDNNGLPLLATVHFGQDFNNAFFDGERMVFGDGDGVLFGRFTASLDVIGHELTHGVTEVEAQLIYQGQSGALNESVSDVFGSLVKQFFLNQTAAAADWLIGADIFTPGTSGDALRSMKAPGTAFRNNPVLGDDPQPDHMNKFVHTLRDHGGVHINSGIPNKAFFLVATTIGGNAWEKPGLIWYDTLRDPRLTDNASFLEFARLTFTNAGRLFGSGNAEQQAVQNAWNQVGIAVP